MQVVWFAFGCVNGGIWYCCCQSWCKTVHGTGIESLFTENWNIYGTQSIVDVTVNIQVLWSK